MAKERRVLRLQQLILEIVAEAVQHDLADPRLGLVSITRVKLSPDLTSAVVFWSELGAPGRHGLTGQALESALPVLQARVAESLSTRVTPRLSLRFDPTLEHAQKLETIFEKLRAERGDPPEGEGDDDLEDGVEDAFEDDDTEGDEETVPEEE